MPNKPSIASERLGKIVQTALDEQPVRDLHTHLYPPAFGTPVVNKTGKVDPTGMMLWGVDELVTYHYLVAEVYRFVPATKLPYEDFWRMTKRQQADHIWKYCFVENTPLSEACRGVLTTLSALGLDPNEKTLDSARKYFNQQDPSEFIDRVMEIANVNSITMTNAVFDDNERARWLANPAVGSDKRFAAVLRIDPLLRAWSSAAKKLNEWGYRVNEEISAATIDEVRRFLRDWIDKQKAVYLALSLPPEFRYPAVNSDGGQAILEKAILPVCGERGLPFAMMIGSRLRVNPGLRDGGDMLGLADVASVVNLCHHFPDNKFLVTMLARENQHELCVAARKFGNLMIFGCWWFLNNPSLIEEIERMRFELLGVSFVPQHSDARILDQLIYKWRHSRNILAKVLSDKYADLIATGRNVTEADIRRDARLLLSENFTRFLAR